MQEIIYYNKLTFSHSSHFRLTQEHTMGNTDDIFQVLGDRKKKHSKIWAPREWYSEFVKAKWTQGSWLCETQSTIQYVHES